MFWFGMLVNRPIMYEKSLPDWEQKSERAVAASKCWHGCGIRKASRYGNHRKESIRSTRRPRTGTVSRRQRAARVVSRTRVHRTTLARVHVHSSNKPVHLCGSCAGQDIMAEDSCTVVRYVTQVFLSYASEDRQVVRRLYDRLKLKGFRPWVDEIDIDKGRLWDAEIRKQVTKSQVVVVCMSQVALTKEALRREIRLILDAARKRPKRTIFVIPVRIESCELPRELARRQWVNLFEPSGFDQLVTAIRNSRAKAVCTLLRHALQFPNDRARTVQEIAVETRITKSEARERLLQMAGKGEVEFGREREDNSELVGLTVRRPFADSSPLRQVPRKTRSRTMDASTEDDNNLFTAIGALIDSSNVPMYLTDHKLIVRRCNESLAQLFDSTKRSLTGCHVSELVRRMAMRVPPTRRRVFLERQGGLVDRMADELAPHSEDSEVIDNRNLPGNSFNGCYKVKIHADKVSAAPHGRVLGLFVFYHLEPITTEP
jgi:PAS domain-containing protein